MPESIGPTGTIPCPACGADRPAGAPPGAEDDEPITHCEWCGAEYPIPEHESVPEGHSGSGPSAPESEAT